MIQFLPLPTGPNFKRQRSRAENTDLVKSNSKSQISQKLVSHKSVDQIKTGFHKFQKYKSPEKRA